MKDVDYQLAVVIPCYNEETRLPRRLILEWADRHPDWLWVLVDDGSKDGTLSLLELMQTQRSNLTALSLPQNSGKAQAVRHGLLWAEKHCAARWLSYLDADFATPPDELERMLGIHADGPALLILGCRLQRLGANIERNAIRHYIGRVAASLISLFLKMPTYDTQCGAKLVHRSLVPLVLDQPFLTRWLFDVEMLARARNHFGLRAWLAMAIEEPLREWQEKGGSKLKPQDFFKLPYELWRLDRAYNRPDRTKEK